MGIDNEISERGVIPCPVTGRRRAQTASLFWFAKSNTDNCSPLLFFTLLQGSTPLTNFANYPHCFGTAFTSDVMSQLNSRERGAASDSKNPDPYCSSCFTYIIITCITKGLTPPPPSCVTSFMNAPLSTWLWNDFSRLIWNTFKSD